MWKCKQVKSLFVPLFHRSIKSEKDLDKEMLSAQNEELERQKRLMELKKSLLRENAAASAISAKAAAVSTEATTSTADTTKSVSACTSTSTPKEKDSQLKSLLQGQHLLFFWCCSFWIISPFMSEFKCLLMTCVLNVLNTNCRR